MARYSPKKTISHGIDEVTFKNHISEFQRFYRTHKSFCDEVAGIKPRKIIENNELVEFYIVRENFIFAIRKLTAFIIDNLHYIKKISDIRILYDEALKIEEKYLNDEEYHKMVKKSRTKEEEILLNKKYLQYIIEVYEIGNMLVNLLQSSLMITTSKVSKDVEYHNETAFFDELSQYRSEISDSISNYRFSDTLIQLKKILGYHYTYKIFLKQEERNFTSQLLQMLIDEILQEDVIKLITKVSKEEYLLDEEKKKMKEYQYLIKKALLKIYYITNKNLSDRKILPKITQKIHIDKTLI